MPRYIDVDKLANMIQAKAETLIAGKEAFLYVAKWLDFLSSADVVPKSQYDLAVAEREANVKGFTEQIGRMNVEIQALRAAANSYKMHYENARSEVVSEVLQMIKNICAYEERLSYQTIEEGIKRQMALKASRTKVDRCVVCGESVPEGRQICSMCEVGQKYLKKKE